MALFDVLKYADHWPQLGKILKIESGKVLVHWYEGNRTTSWKPAKHCVDGQFEALAEDIHIQCMWKWGFKLTPCNVLPQTIQQAALKYYEDL